MTMASGTATRAEVVTLYKACIQLEIALQMIVQGDSLPNVGGRFTAAQCDAPITAVSNAITAVNT